MFRRVLTFLCIGIAVVVLITQLLPIIIKAYSPSASTLTIKESLPSSQKNINNATHESTPGPTLAQTSDPTSTTEPTPGSPTQKPTFPPDLDWAANFADFRESPASTPAMATPLFWHIPKAGGTSAKQLAVCLELIYAAQLGKDAGPPSLDILDKHRRHYMNIDTTSSTGIEEAKRLGFAEHHDLVDVVYSPLLKLATEGLFNEDHQASLFGLFRHPVERAVSLFYYLQIADWEKTYNPELANTTIEDYFVSGGGDQNWMVYFLTGQPPTSEHLAQAKAILAQKAVIGLTSQMAESLRRFGIYYGWDSRDEWDDCVQKLSQHGANANPDPKVVPNSTEWTAIAKNNEYDIELYEYALELFEAQGRLSLFL
jgi:hypothetical protein